jgi:amidase
MEGAPTGPLAHTQFAVKDFFSLAGHVTGAGSPDWLRTHRPSAATSPAVKKLLDAGARLVGRTMTDELACSMSGINPHYGTPINPAAADRLPGGSSSGSAAVVGAGEVDFALGTDTSGSVRVPASYCGVFGMRPSHGRVSTVGVVPLCPSFDTVGWFARTPQMLRSVGEVLLAKDRAGAFPATMDAPLLVCLDAFTYADESVQDLLIPVVRRMADRLGTRPQGVDFFLGGIDRWQAAHFVLTEVEFWEAHGYWIETEKPTFGPDVGARMKNGNRIPPAAADHARRVREKLRAHAEVVLGEGRVAVLPTAPALAPKVGTKLDTLLEMEMRAIGLNCAASLAGLPQLTLPVAKLDGCPVGLSLLSGPGMDEWLLEIAETVFDAIKSV